MYIPSQLVANCSKAPERRAWLLMLPDILEEVKRRWSIRPGVPFEHANVTCSWVASVVRTDGSTAVLKIAMPHMEGAHEIDGLRYWNGDPTVRLLEADDGLGAMLLEPCTPGTMLRDELPEKQDAVIATIFNRLRGATTPPSSSPFRHLSEMLLMWRQETLAQRAHWQDEVLVAEGLQVLQDLAKPSATDTLLATDLHAANVLSAEREPWLMIDPKPFLGDSVYDLVQYLHTCEARLGADPLGTVNRLAELADVSKQRLRAWTFARAAADPRENWKNATWMNIARSLAP